MKRVVDLGDQTVDVVRRRCGDVEVRFAAVCDEQQWSIRRGPRIAWQQTSDDGICWTTECGDLARIGHARGRVQSDAFALTFVSEVKERLVAFDWTTNRAAELIVPERG